ncbi:hypothetical protein PIB30_102374 [Stylosanthes scabra]|uniref:Uncharacterized protein n=1 Tax=Stylosanthes scabra TaxID=79078 RepID=A0ABU6RYA1_9FABA|nr:hypothetical protein [Stylosanthes scabra]
MTNIEEEFGRTTILRCLASGEAELQPDDGDAAGRDGDDAMELPGGDAELDEGEEAPGDDAEPAVMEVRR